MAGFGGNVQVTPHAALNGEGRAYADLHLHPVAVTEMADDRQLRWGPGRAARLAGFLTAELSDAKNQDARLLLRVLSGL
jgi:hypothetical protein